MKKLCLQVELFFFLFYCNEYSLEKEAKINGESVSPQWENVE